MHRHVPQILRATGPDFDTESRSTAGAALDTYAFSIGWRSIQRTGLRIHAGGTERSSRNKSALKAENIVREMPQLAEAAAAPFPRRLRRRVQGVHQVARGHKTGRLSAPGRTHITVTEKLIGSGQCLCGSLSLGLLGKLETCMSVP